MSTALLVLVFIFIVAPAMRWGFRGGEHGGWDEWGRHRRTRSGARTRDLEVALEERDGLIAALESRVAELENRLDFTERVLATRANGDALLVSNPRGTADTGAR
ncbi:MAG: hypothetical protein AB7R55_15010 [Gemmatimonadales bacterium]